ncbi:copper chaperone PCu(A)C [Arsukibacterium indicum]|uniref:Copper chaperone PCu(A)C n=1 Tax=Arsukibacterium indicum TaxID=2848612 RepID=A0ABS6MPF8_9GAMM|nr:copper chaperone PCu(A)C [Arsukibacterium indicum]MBV2130719.1 copper chaperone PCu(A)C [Arsukibacterium indicum]
MIRLTAFIFIAAFALSGTPVNASEITVTEGQVRVPMPGRTVTAGYFTINNNTSEAIKLLSADSAAFERAELHQHTHQDGVMRMEHVSHIDIAANGSVSLQPGGLHLMLFNPVQPLLAGESVMVVLRFSNGQQLELSMPLTEMPRR